MCSNANLIFFSRESPMRLLCLISVSIPTRLHFIQHYGA